MNYRPEGAAPDKPGAPESDQRVDAEAAMEGVARLNGVHDDRVQPGMLRPDEETLAGGETVRELRPGAALASDRVQLGQAALFPVRHQAEVDQAQAQGIRTSGDWAQAQQDQAIAAGRSAESLAQVVDRFHWAEPVGSLDPSTAGASHEASDGPDDTTQESELHQAIMGAQACAVHDLAVGSLDSQQLAQNCVLVTPDGGVELRTGDLIEGSSRPLGYITASEGLQIPADRTVTVVTNQQIDLVHSAAVGTGEEGQPDTAQLQTVLRFSRSSQEADIGMNVVSYTVSHPQDGVLFPAAEEAIFGGADGTDQSPYQRLLSSAAGQFAASLAEGPLMAKTEGPDGGVTGDSPEVTGSADLPDLEDAPDDGSPPQPPGGGGEILSSPDDPDDRAEQLAEQIIAQSPESREAVAELLRLYKGAAEQARGQVDRVELAEAATERAQEEARKIMARLLSMREDILVERALTPAGLIDFLDRDDSPEAEIARGIIRNGEVGVEFLDGRHVNYVNRFGHDVGDRYIAETGRAIHPIIERSAARVDARRNGEVGLPPGVQERRTADPEEGDRRHTPSIPDTVVRLGGDELAIIYWGVKPGSMSAIHNRIVEPLGVHAAVERDQRGEVPFMASAGSAHLNTVREQVQEILSSGAEDVYSRAIAVVVAIADSAQEEQRNEQYDQMWRYATAGMAGDPERPADTRVISRLFLERCCPNFMATLRDSE